MKSILCSKDEDIKLLERQLHLCQQEVSTLKKASRKTYKLNTSHQNERFNRAIHLMEENQWLKERRDYLAEELALANAKYASLQQLTPANSQTRGNIQ